MFSCSIWTYTFKLEMCVTVAVCAVGKAGSVEISCRKLCQVSLGRRFFFLKKKLFYKMTFLFNLVKFLLLMYLTLVSNLAYSHLTCCSVNNTTLLFSKHWLMLEFEVGGTWHSKKRFHDK